MESEETRWVVSEVYDAPQKLSLAKMSRDDQPREKLIDKGPEALSNAELLAILIGSGNADESAVALMQRIMHECKNSLKRLGRMTLDELKDYKGIGDAKAVTIAAACELGRRRQAEGPIERESMETAKEVYDYMHPKMQDLDVEEAWVLLLNNNLKLQKAERISHGGLSETSVDVRLIMRHAVLNNSTAIVLVHNHPSGNNRPSRDDDNLTKRVSDACRTMRLHLADHIIITDGNYYSYREENKL